MSFELPTRDALPEYPVLVGGESRKDGSGAAWSHIYPANGQVTAEFTLAGAADVDAAVADEEGSVFIIFFYFK